MPIGGNNDTFTITGAKLKVDQGVEVGGSVAYTTDATGFGGVSAQIDNNNTLNITSGKLAGVAKIERNTAATITAITHTNVNNNTTIHLALKNTSTDKGVFITLGTFSTDDTVKVNYTDNYLIGPGETGMITLRKVNGVLSLFVREMFTSKATSFDNTDNSPFYIKDGVNYKYPLYKFAGTGLTSEVIQGTEYFRPSTGLTSQTRPPKGLPENVVPPTGSFKIGNNVDMTTIHYDVYNTVNSESGTIYKGSTQKVRFALDVTHNEASGSFTDSGVSSGDTYTLYLDKNATTSTDTTNATAPNSQPLAVFHNGTFNDGGDPYSHGSITAAATAGYFYSDTASGTYGMGTLTSATYTAASGSSNGDMRNRVEAFTTYVWTPTTAYEADVLVVAGGGGGGADDGGGGGAGGFIEKKAQTISGAQTIVVGDGGIGQTQDYNQTCYASSDGGDSSISGLSLTAIGGGGGGSNHNNQSTERNGRSGGSGGGSSGKNGALGGSGTTGQGFDGATNPSGSQHRPSGGGGASEAGTDGAEAQSDGGDGKSSDILGTTYWWSGGGGGAAHHKPKGKGGKGGGGSGAFSPSFGGGVSDTNGVSDAEPTPGSIGHWHQRGSNAGKHTGGGAGGGAYHNGDGGKGGSGMVVIRDIGLGKKVSKLASISNVTAISSKTINYTFNVQGPGIDKVTYKIGSGSEVTMASGVYTLAYTPADYGTTTITQSYAVDSLGNQVGVKMTDPYSVLTKLSSLGHITAPILSFFNMGTTVTDSVNSVAFTTDSGSFTYDTANNAITNTGSARMKLDFTSVRTDRNTAISAFYEFYLPNGTKYEYAASLGGVHDTNGNNNDAIGWFGGASPATHYYGNGVLGLPTKYEYSNYYGKWVKLGWVREANGHNFRVYVDGVLASTHTPDDGSLTGTGVLSYFYLFRHACYGNENNYTTNDAISFRNLEIYQASFTSAEILDAFGS
jgi:hypothetical protein